MVRLIASDIDGTLLRDGQWSIDPSLFDEIRRLRALGILFCPASGRQYSSLRRLFAPVAGELTYLCENGAVVYGPGSPGPVLASAPMDQALALELCRDIIGQEDCEVLISGADTGYLCPKGRAIVEHMVEKVRSNVAVLERPEDVPEPILKVAAFCAHGAQAMRPVLAPRWEGRFRVAQAGWEWLDFTQTDKGAGLRRMCAALGIPLGEVMAFGDNFNDAAMLEAAGMAYIMDTADPALLERFPNHCRRVEDILRQLR